MKNQLPNFQTGKKYDLEERTAKFAEEIIDGELLLIFSAIIRKTKNRKV